MDEARVDAVLDKLVTWGFAEDHNGDVQPTRRWNAKLQAAAEKINLLVQKTGQTPAGKPLLLAVEQALAAENLTTDEHLFQDAVHVLVMLELSRMSPAKRVAAGFPDVRFPGDSDAGDAGVSFHPGYT